MQQRLITATQVARKLGYQSVTGFTQALTRLMETEGFPGPVIGTHGGLRQKWDDLAIDTWIDNRTPAHLRRQAISTKIEAADQIEIERKLAERAARLGNREPVNA
jgi:predicted DNA-binding transcriptional regulator AlpA